MEGHVFVFAGLNSGSTILFYLLHHPHELQRLETKISGTLDHIDGIRMGSALQHCRYLSSRIDKTLRMSPAIAGLPPVRFCVVDSTSQP